jgi:hypothetical protein
MMKWVTARFADTNNGGGEFLKVFEVIIEE